MVEERAEYRMNLRKLHAALFIEIETKGGVPIVQICLRPFEGNWDIDVRKFNPQEDEKFFEWSKQHSPDKRGRRAWEELSTHLAKWHKKAGRYIRFEVLQTTSLPRGFMHPRYSQMESILATPKELFQFKRPYRTPKLLHTMEQATEETIKGWRRLRRMR